MKTDLLLFWLAVTAAAFAGGPSVTGVAAWDLALRSADSLPSGTVMPVTVREPQRAAGNMLLSLALPGAGQYRTERYTKAAIFLAAEAAFIVVALVNDKKGDDKTAEYKEYADAHWSAVRYAQWIGKYGVTDYGPAGYSFDASDLAAIRNRKDFSKINAWERGLHTQGISHTLPAYGEQQYFELIGKYHQFKYGWDTYPKDAEGVPVSDNGIVDDLVPQQLKDYAAERGKANDYYYAASFAASALVINHVVSAVDALLSTKAYNDEISAGVTVRPVPGENGMRLMSELRVSVGL
ncbi:MAG: hypothetical protein F9K22_02405 [Bacteroidetes bacterium]|nr:MAG: hypothetical protein F9K22_02405 [Bacteroidota bacterium]